MKHFPPVIERLLAATVLCLAFILMASVFRPRGSDAGPGESTVRGGDQPRMIAGESTDPHAGMRSLGELTGRNYIVRIYGSADEPRYSIYSSTGEELAVLLRAEQVDALFDDIELNDLIGGADDGQMIMLVDPDDRL